MANRSDDTRVARVGAEDIFNLMITASLGLAHDSAPQSAMGNLASCCDTKASTDYEHIEARSPTVCYERERTKKTKQIAEASDEVEKAKLTTGLERWTYLEKCYEAWSDPSLGSYA